MTGSDITTMLLKEIAGIGDFREPDFGASWDAFVARMRQDPRIAAIPRGKAIVFLGISFEQARHAAALAEATDCVPVLLRTKGDRVLEHYERAFPVVIPVDQSWQMFATLLALRPAAVTLTLPSRPLYYRTMLPLLQTLCGIKAVPFVYDFVPPPACLMSDMMVMSRHILENCGGFYSWHAPMDEVQGGHWTPICTYFNVPPIDPKPRSIVYVGTLSPYTAEANTLALAKPITEQGFTLDLFDARNDVSPEKVTIPGVTYHRRVPEYELLDRLNGYQFGLTAPYTRGGFHPMYGSDGDWCNRHGVPGKMVMYMEAGVIPIVHAETEYAAEFIERFDIGYVFSDGDYHNIDAALARKSPERLRENLLRLRERELNWRTHAPRLAQYLTGPAQRVEFPRHRP